MSPQLSDEESRVWFNGIEEFRKATTLSTTVGCGRGGSPAARALLVTWRFVGNCFFHDNWKGVTPKENDMTCVVIDLSLCPIAGVTSGVYLFYSPLFHSVSLSGHKKTAPAISNSEFMMSFNLQGSRATWCCQQKIQDLWGFAPISPSYTVKRQNQGQSAGMSNIQTNARILKTSQPVQDFVQQQH